MFLSLRLKKKQREENKKRMEWKGKSLPFLHLLDLSKVSISSETSCFNCNQKKRRKLLKVKFFFIFFLFFDCFLRYQNGNKS